MRKIIVATFLCMSLGLLPVSGLASDTEPDSVMLEPVVVTGTKTKHTLENVPVETVLLTREDIDKSNAKNVSALLGEIPGFNFSQQSDLAGSVGYKSTIRGLNAESRNLLILVDGQRVFTGFHSGGMEAAGFSHNVNVVPVSMIERIEVVKGPGSALYGSDATVGVLNIITKRPTNEYKGKIGGSYGKYTVDGNDYVMTDASQSSRTTYETHATASGPLTDSVRMTLNLSHEGNDGINPTRYDVSQNYIHSQMEMDVTDDFTVRAGAEFTDWQSENNDLSDEKTEEAPRLWVVGDYAISDEHLLKVQGYYQKLSADFDDPLYGKQEADVSYSDAELQYTGFFLDDHIITAGVEFLQESLDTTRVKDEERTTTSLYLQDEWCLLNSDLVIVPGVRFDSNSEYGEEWNPKLSAMYTPIPGTKLRASAGMSFKAPSAMQTAGTDMTDGYMWITPNSDLDPERAFTWQLGIEQDLFEDRLLVGLTYYNTKVEDMITTAATGKLKDGLPLMTYENKDEADLQGIEASANITITDPLHLLLTYAYTDARDGETGNRLVNTPEHAFGAKLNYDNDTYDFGGTLSLSHTTDQLNTDYGISGASERTKDYTTVDLKVWKDFWEDARITLSATNLFDEPLRGSDTIYVRRSFIAQLDFTF